MKGVVLLSFDVEEFDLPLEYNQLISLEEQLEIGRLGFEAVMPVVNDFNINCTMFTTANYALHFPQSIKQLDHSHEVASHTFYHSSFKIEDLILSKKILEEITGKPVTGLRMPRMKKVNMKDVANAGYIYDSSVNPTFLPGKYNNLYLPRTLYYEENVVRMPASVSPLLRLPLFWLAFKNYPLSFFINLCRQCIKKDGYVCLYFHPWEFTDIKKYNLPWYVKRIYGEKLIKKLQMLIAELKKDYTFTSIHDFIIHDSRRLKIINT